MNKREAKRDAHGHIAELIERHKSEIPAPVYPDDKARLDQAVEEIREYHTNFSGAQEEGENPDQLHLFEAVQFQLEVTRPR